MNATLILLLSSLLMGTSFLSEVPEEGSPSPSKVRDGDQKLRPFSHPLLTGAAAIRGCATELRRGQYAENDEEVAPSYGGRPPPRRKQPSGDYYDVDDDDYDGGGGGGWGEECRVRFGLHYASCFSKHKDFDDKFDQLQHHVQSWPRGGARGGSSGSPCGTLQLLAKVKSSPLFERCQGNQYVVRTPYQMYNVKGELRYIVQDPPHLEQCYLEAQCSIPGDLCRGYLGGGRPGGVSRGGARCESRHCHHTLLAWDPDLPDSGTFFDVFEYSCCCNCHNTIAAGRTAG